MFWCVELRTLRLVLLELERLVVDPGVPIVSESLIRLQGVVSLTFLQPSEQTHYTPLVWSPLFRLCRKSIAF